LDKITESVQAVYEAYPYPASNAVDCNGYHVRLLLSYLKGTSPICSIQLPCRRRRGRASCAGMSRPTGASTACFMKRRYDYRVLWQFERREWIYHQLHDLPEAATQ